jgi:hypothetical protein
MVISSLRRRTAAVLSGFLLLASVACTDQHDSASSQSDGSGNDGKRSSTADRFGIQYLYPSLPNGLTWESQWGQTANFDKVDPNDPWFDVNHGTASYQTSAGQLFITGRTPRMYVHDPELKRQWHDVEITTYFKRVGDANVPYAGMTAVTRANHGVTGDETQDLCDTRGYGARIRYDGRTDFEKETSHPFNSAQSERKLFRDGMPFNRWIGFKFVVYDVNPHSVKLELWIDLKGNGHWVKQNELTDNGRFWGTRRCAPGIDPRLVLDNTGHRDGSESGRPNLSTYFRSDGVAKDGLVYKQASIREISVP